MKLLGDPLSPDVKLTEFGWRVYEACGSNDQNLWTALGLVT